MLKLANIVVAVILTIVMFLLGMAVLDTPANAFRVGGHFPQVCGINTRNICHPVYPSLPPR